MPPPDGWKCIPLGGFGAHVGPFWRPPGNLQTSGFSPDGRHANKRGVVHGGMLVTAFDLALSDACRDAAGGRARATIQLNVAFIGALQLGEFAVITAEVVRATSSLVFMRGVMRVDDRVIATADGVWKLLQRPGASQAPTAPAG